MPPSPSRSRLVPSALRLTALLLGAVALLARRRASRQDIRPARAAVTAPGLQARRAHGVQDIPWRGWRNVAWRAWGKITAGQIPMHAGAIAFFALMALFPALVSFISVYGLLADPSAVYEHLAAFDAFLPPSIRAFLSDQMMRLIETRPERLSWTLGLSLLLSLWSAGAAAKAVIWSLNSVYEERERRSFAALNGVVLAFIVGFVALALLLISAFVALPAAAALGLIPEAASALRWPLQLLAAALALAALYRFAPCRAHARWRWISLGSLAATLLWLAASAAFSLYLAHAGVEAAYGPLAAAIGFIIWTYWTALIVLIGAVMNAEIEHETSVDSTIGPPAPMGERGAVMADTLGEEAPG